MEFDTIFLIGFVIILVIGLGVPCILGFSQAREEIKSNEEHQQFVDSIKPGDVFDWDIRDIRPYRDPFDDTDDKHLPARTTIIDIKTNEAGVKWVKYYYTINGSNSMWFTDKLDDYLQDRYRIYEAE